MNRHIREEQLALFAGGDLKEKEALRLGHHLSGCPACRERVESYRGDREELSALRETGIDESDLEFVRRSVLSRLPAERQAGFRFTPLSWGTLAAAILVSAAIGIRYWSRVPAEQYPGLPEPARRTQAEPARTAPARQDASPARTAAAKSSKVPRIPRQLASATLSLPAVAAAGRPAAPAQSMQDEVIIKLETSDPNVVIIWLASPKGAER